MEPAVEQISTQWSEAKHLRPGVPQFDGTAGDGYQRSLDIPVPREYVHHVLATESMADFVAPVLVVVSARFAGP